MDILKLVLVFIFHKVIRYHKTSDRKNPKEDMDNIQREYARYKQNPELMIESEKEILFSWIYNSQDITAQEGAFFDKHQVPNIIVSKYLSAKFFFEAFDGETFKLKSSFQTQKQTKRDFSRTKRILMILLTVLWICLSFTFHSLIHTQSILEIVRIVLFISFFSLMLLLVIFIDKRIEERDMADDFLEYTKNLN